MQKEVVQHKTQQPQQWSPSDQTADWQQKRIGVHVCSQQHQQQRSQNVYKSVCNVISDHLHFCVLPFHVEKGERQDDSYDRLVEKLMASGWAKAGFEQVCPGWSQQPDDGEGYCAVGAQHEEEAVAEDVASDGAKFVEEVDSSREARGHVCDVWEGSA